MDLRDYLKTAAISPDAFREKLAAAGLDVSAGGLRKWISGERTPRPAAMLVIESATAGTVKPADWMKRLAA